VKTSGKTKLFFELLAAVIVVFHLVAFSFLGNSDYRSVIAHFYFCTTRAKVSSMVNNFSTILNNLLHLKPRWIQFDQLEKEEQTETGQAIFINYKRDKSTIGIVLLGENQLFISSAFLFLQIKQPPYLDPSGVGKRQFNRFNYFLYSNQKKAQYHIDGIPL